MPKQSPQRKNKRRQRPKGRLEAVPHFEPFSNKSAGQAALGLRIGFPAERTVKLTYVDYVTMTSSLGAIGNYTFSLNSAYDPNTSGVGHQPLGFDQWSLFYNHYVVEACDYDVAVISSGDAYVGTYLSDDTTLPTGLEAACELGGVFAAITNGLPSHTFKGHVKLAEFFNRSDIAADSALRADVTANPSDQAYVTLMQRAPSSTEDLILHYMVKLTYTVRFMEPKDLGPSIALKQVDEPVDSPTDSPPGPGNWYRVPSGPRAIYPVVKTK